MLTGPVLRETPISSFHVLDMAMVLGRKKKRKNVIWTLYDDSSTKYYTNIKDTRKTEKRLFSVENGKPGKRQYGLRLNI